MIDSVLISNGDSKEYDLIATILAKYQFHELQRCDKCFAKSEVPLTANRMLQVDNELIDRIGKHLAIEWVDGSNNRYIQQNIPN